MRKVEILLLIVLFLSGCATFNTKGPQKSFEEIINMKLNQAIAIAETSLEISKNAERKSIEALNTSNEAIKKVNEAIDVVNETREFAQKEVQRAIDEANKAKDEAIKFADESSKKAIDAANEAIKIANQSSERSISVANQVLAELNRLRSTIQMKEEEPIVEEEPKSGKYYTIKKGDTLKKIAYKFYNDTSKWKLIYEVNKKVIKNPNALIPGTKIYIP